MGDSMSAIRWVPNHMPASDDRWLPLMAPERIAEVRAFHQSFPQYDATPLVPLPALAARLGLGGVFVKDESYRFGLNSFKVLGSSYAIASHIAKSLGRSIAQTGYDYLTSDELVRDFGQATFFIATDGNHGRGAAWAAKRLHQKAVVRMPKGTSRSRFDNIAKEGAEVTIEDMNYDECVRLVAEQAAACPNGVIVQDTAWEGYVDIPNWIMQGYGTLSLEAAEQLRALGVARPTHVFVQAGVGSFAASCVGLFANLHPEDPPCFVVDEASCANCYYEGALAGDGDPRPQGGDFDTIMAGLACGEPSPVGWDILRNHADAFLSNPDWVTARGMRVLASPLRGDTRVVSGESGAVNAGALVTIMLDPAYAELRDALGLGPESQVLLVSTEGDTDPERYERIVWDGAWPVPS